MQFLDKIRRTALRTFQPYVVLRRYVLLFDAMLAILFLLLTGLRLLLDRSDCPVYMARVGSGMQSVVRADCASGRWWEAFGSNIIDNLAAGLVVAIVSSILLMACSPRHVVEEDVAALEPWNIRPVLDAALPTTRRYWFRGRSGRFLRTSVMPVLGDAGSRQSQLREMSILLPDPTNHTTLADYAFYRNSLKGQAGRWTAERIRDEILATIITAARHVTTNHFLQIEVYLANDFSLFRMDMADDQLVLSREDPMWPAILCSGRSKFYASYIEEFRNEAAKAARVPLGKASVPDPLLAADVPTIVAALNIVLNLSQADAENVARAVNSPDLPYD